MFCRLPTLNEMCLDDQFIRRQMGIMSTSSSSTTTKRKGCTIDNLLEAKRSLNLAQIRRELTELIDKKTEFLNAQKRASLFVDTRNVSDPCIMDEFAKLYQKLKKFDCSGADASEYSNLVQETLKESIIIEWPRMFPTLSNDFQDAEIDFSPLIHRARNVVKCRTSHPTMRVKICALTKETCPTQMETMFRATLVKLTNEDTKSRQVAGRMILTQREGIPVTKSQEQSGASVNADGKLVSSQSTSDTFLLADQLDEPTCRVTPLKFENGMLCATFPEMGVTLNSMIDRRQLATRYAIQVEVFLCIDNTTILSHVVLSHPFLIAITNDQTEPLLQSIFWNRLVNCDQNELCDLSDSMTITWSILKQALRAFVKSQLPSARFLFDFEMHHIQAMILLPRILECQTSEEFQLLEFKLFGSLKVQTEHDEIRRLRDRLLNESIKDDCEIEKREFMTDHTISILDMSTVLEHSVWLWLHRASEMIQDVGHKLCPSPAVDKKSTKTKKQMAAAEDYQTVLSLFNKGFLTFCSIQKAAESFGNFEKCMLIRFCDENLAHFSFCYGIVSGKPRIGSISAEQIKDFKQGLPELLIDEHFPSRFSNVLKLSADINDSVKKLEIFHNYTTQRRKMDSIAILDNETSRVDVLSGAQLARQTPPPSSAHISMPHDLTPFLASLLEKSAGNNETLMKNIDFESLLEIFTANTANTSESGVDQVTDDSSSQIARLLLEQEEQKSSNP